MKYRRVLIFVLLILLATGAMTDGGQAWAPTADSSTDRAVQSSTAPQVIPEGDPSVVPIVYRFFDWGNDWQTLRPDYGPIGAIHFYMWEDVNPAPGVYDWSVIDRKLDQERALRVTLPDGQEIPKPVVIQIFPYISSATGWENVHFYDGTPEWVYDQIDLENPSTPRPIVNDRKVGYKLQGCDAVAVLPMYDSLVWQNAYFDCVRAFGARYNGDPQVTSVVINTGLDGETQLTKDFHCNWEYLVDTTLPAGVRYRFGQYMIKAMDVYRAAFPDKAIFINNAPGGGGTRLATSEYAASLDPPVGLKHSGMWVDLDSHQGYGNYVGSWDMIREYSTTLPIWLESPYGFGSSELKYWSFIAGLHYHPDAVDVHPDFLTMTDPDFLRWVGEHLGRSIYDTPSVWTVLRDSEFPLQQWSTGGVSGHVGDWTFWLYRTEPQGAKTVRIWREDLPAAVREHIYSRQTRRTDQANGQHYMAFDVDDTYPYVAHIPESEPDGQVSYRVKVILLNKGTDWFSLQYKNYAGQTVSKRVRKGAALGATNQWVTVDFVLDDAYLDNNLPNGADLQLFCEGDGDEIVHLVELSGIWGVMPTATPTRTATATPTSTSTPTSTATNTPTQTSTKTPTITPTYTPLVGGLAAADDAEISGLSPSQNRGQNTTFTLGGNGQRRALVRFDLSQIPAGAGVLDARLRLRSTGATGASVIVRAYGLNTGWSESEATWLAPAQSLSWSAQGADAAPADRDADPSASAAVQGGQAWYELNLTALANAWTKGLRPNHGLLLVADGPIDCIFSSSEGSYTPQLQLQYQLPTLTPTFTPTYTPSPTPTEGPTLTPSPTLAPTPTPIYGALTFRPQQDTYVSEWFSMLAFGQDPLLIVRQGDISSALLRFDLGEIPPGTQVHAAYMNLYVNRRTNDGGMYAKVYKVRREWSEDTANWTRARTGVDWSQPGCNGLGTDRDSEVAVSVLMDDANYWFSFDVTAMVQSWVDDPASNRGLVIKGAGSVSVQYEFASAQWNDLTFAPQLVVSAGDIPPTPTPSITPTPSQTATPTATSAESATPTVTVQQTPTVTPTRTLTTTPTQTLTRTPTRTSTATPTQGPTATTTPTLRATPTVLSGASVLPLTVDTYISSWAIDTNFSGDPEFIVRQGDIKSPLLYVDLAAFEGKEIESARLVLYVAHRTNAGNLFTHVHEILRDWSGDRATWVSADSDALWSESGCNSLGLDRSGETMGELLLNNEHAWVSYDITEMVRHWLADADNNHGLVVKGSGEVSVQYEFASLENPMIDARPRVEIIYKAPVDERTATPTATPSRTATSVATQTMTPTLTGTATRTATPTYTASPTPSRTATVSLTPLPSATLEATPVLEQVVLSSGQDTYMSLWFPDTLFGQETFLWVRQGDIIASALAFDLANLPLGAEVERARLELYVPLRSNTNALTASAYRILTPWDAGGANWYMADSITAWAASGCNAEDRDRLTISENTQRLDAVDKWVTFDVTQMARYWATHRHENYGLILKGALTGTSVGYAFASFDYQLPSLRPRLVIDYAVNPEVVEYVVPLRQGQNMVALPLRPQDVGVGSVLASLGSALRGAWTFAPAASGGSWQVYLPGEPSDLVALDIGQGFWLDLETDAELRVTGSAVESLAIPLLPGWNLVGYPLREERGVRQALASVSQIDMVWSYQGDDPDLPWKRFSPTLPEWGNTLEFFEPGRGYWLHATAACEVVLE